jgi:hypothetical protein
MGPVVANLTAPGHLPTVVSPAAGSAPGGGRLPRAGWPEKTDLDYVKVAVEVALLLVAVPYLLKRLVTRPAATSRKAGEHHLG